MSEREIYHCVDTQGYARDYRVVEYNAQYAFVHYANTVWTCEVTGEQGGYQTLKCPFGIDLFGLPLSIVDDVKTGHNCSKCNTLNEFAESNRPDGTYLCFECR